MTSSGAERRHREQAMTFLLERLRSGSGHADAHQALAGWSAIGCGGLAGKCTFAVLRIAAVQAARRVALTGKRKQARGRHGPRGRRSRGARGRRRRNGWRRRVSRRGRRRCRIRGGRWGRRVRRCCRRVAGRRIPRRRLGLAGCRRGVARRRVAIARRRRRGLRRVGIVLTGGNRHKRHRHNQQRRRTHGTSSQGASNHVEGGQNSTAGREESTIGRKTSPDSASRAKRHGSASRATSGGAIHAKWCSTAARIHSHSRTVLATPGVPLSKETSSQ